jgi:CelD/BcsL family acetyltransferase involved in cellulose biosynthesis
MRLRPHSGARNGRDTDQGFALVHPGAVESAGQTSDAVSTVALRVGDLTDGVVAEWADLESRALEPNAYLSPFFVLPALRHLDPDLRPLLLAVRSAAALVGLGVFRERRGSWRFPLRHLSAYRSRHSFLSGLLVDRDCADEVVSSLFDWVAAERWHGLAFSQLPEGPLQQLLFRETACRSGAWLEYQREPRATLFAAEAGEEAVARLSSQRRKKYRRAWRRLEELGVAEWRLRSEQQDGCAERFLELEHLGWKGADGSSLLSTAAGAAFFREMAEGFSRNGRIFYSEVTLGGAAISSTTNLVSGHGGFAFKTGSDPRYASTSVGVLNEVELMRQVPSALPHVQHMDSGAAPGSYLDDLWPGRRLVSDGLLTTTPLGCTVGRLSFAALALKRSALRALRRGSPVPTPDAPAPSRT